MIYLKLFWSFIQVGLFSFGGGYAAMPLIENQVVVLNEWLTKEEFVDVISISQMTPGPIVINAATFVGQRTAGLGGSLIATLGSILPSCIILITIAHFFQKYQRHYLVQGVLEGLRPAVVSLIASSGVSILLLSVWPSGVVSFEFANIDFLAILMFSVCLFLLRKFKLSPILIMMGAGAAGFLLKLLNFSFSVH